MPDDLYVVASRQTTNAEIRATPHTSMLIATTDVIDQEIRDDHKRIFFMR